MKPNGKMFAVRAAMFVVCTVGLLSAFAGAETVRGTFKLPVEAHWGMMVLAPGEYEFKVDTESLARMITITSIDSGTTGMVLSQAVSETSASEGTRLSLAKSKNELYVQTLYLKDAGVALQFAMPKSGMTKLAKSTTTSVASASGTH